MYLNGACVGIHVHVLFFSIHVRYDTNSVGVQYFIFYMLGLQLGFIPFAIDGVIYEL